MPKTDVKNQPALTASYNPYIDIAKFVMSVLVVMIHFHPCEGVLGFILCNVIARVADPMFFIITSYFFFRNIKNKAASEGGYLLKYIRRIAVLYAIAIAVYSPKIFRNYLQSRPYFWSRVLWLAKAVFLEGPYGALWFLTALLTAIPLTYFSAKHLGKKATLAVSFAFYLPAVADTAYSAVLSNRMPLRLFTEVITEIFGWYANGLTFGFFFCSIGMMFALQDDPRENTITRDVICFGLSLTALFAEAFTLRLYGIASDCWAWFFLIPVCVFLMKLLLEAPWKEVTESFIKKSRFLRNMSVIIFVFHVFFKELLDVVLSSSNCWNENLLFRYMLVLSSTMLFAAAVVKLSRYPKFRFLKYLY